MKLDVKAARRNPNTDLPFHFVIKADDMDLRGEIVHGDVVVEGSYVCTGECIILSGCIRADAEYTCGRCLTQVREQLSIPMREEHVERATEMITRSRTPRLLASRVQNGSSSCSACFLKTERQELKR